MERQESSAIRSFDIKRVTQKGVQRVFDTVAVEEPLDISLNYWFKDSPRVQNLALTMRTPGFDRELTAGLLFSEGIIAQPEDLLDLHYMGPGTSNEMVADLARHIDVETWRLARNGVVNSSCGVCGKRSRESIVLPEARVSQPSFTITRELIESLPGLLAAQQHGFSQTGGLHAAALVNSRGEVEMAYEDVGRHNALDKLVGFCYLNGRLPLGQQIVFLSSRSSFELVQKTAIAGGQILASVGGPSSLAIETARAFGITLIGFLRDKRFNIYAGDWRIDLEL